MFVHTTTLWLVGCPDPAEQLRRGVVADPDRTDEFIAEAFTDSVPSAVSATDLSSLASAGDDELFAGHYGDLAVLAGRSLATTSPDELTEFISRLAPDRTVLLLSLDPESSNGTFARWEQGRLVRAFAASPATIRADLGVPYPFESAFWAGERPLQYLPDAVRDPLDLPFHPAELAEEANRQWLGFRFTPPAGDGDTPVDAIPLYSYEIRTADSGAVPASRVSRRVEPVPAAVSPADVEVTAPIAPVSDDPPSSRGPGPISRYFGFRGRI
ncbi:hypothetical protein nbrc107696_15340 [Gordonia spumicola]|uniref:Uncharacterized protein n=1 Tax=Gordonia spumicola TaxID=589161 RepID=A0A7I9V6T5_9ACTN|nr:hypothetical protein [Gordonia spumicola]GEE01088.1 hypothetical protein nbrc107696_15340 [Gordonia spumicola]